MLESDLLRSQPDEVAGVIFANRSAVDIKSMSPEAQKITSDDPRGEVIKGRYSFLMRKAL
jgi:hypothetical protein